jgi:hypothetical protein
MGGLLGENKSHPGDFLEREAILDIASLSTNSNTDYLDQQQPDNKQVIYPSTRKGKALFELHLSLTLHCLQAQLSLPISPLYQCLDKAGFV